MTYAIAAAGTGGHLFPALAVADELVRRGVPKADIAFIGSDRLEATLVPDAGYDLIAVDMHGLRRSLSLRNLSLPAVVLRATRAITAELERRRVAAMLVMGGYISVPSAMAARRRRIPFVVHEQNGQPGLANRLMARWARRVLVAFPEAATKMPGAEVVGNPLRTSLVALDKASHRPDSRRRYQLPADGFVLGVMGGSQGAASINAAIGRYAMLPDRPPIVHIVGATHGAAMEALAAEASIPWRIVPFENAMEDFYAASDLVVSRAGASTVSELAATGTPSILVPLEAVAQQNNAAFLADAGGAVIVSQSEMGTLAATIDGIVSDRARCDAMAAAAKAASRPDSAAAVADALEAASG